MIIAIPSSGRATRQTTWANLPPSIAAQTHVFVYEREMPAYKAVNSSMHLKSVPAHIQGIGAKRQFILEEARKCGVTKVVMLDDDLTFAVRRKDRPQLFTTPVDADIELMFEDIKINLSHLAHVGVSPREGANRNPFEKLLMNTRPSRILGYRVDILEQENISFGDMNLMEDFYISLSLLTRGHDTANLNWIVQNQQGSNTSGGCSQYRTMERQAEASLALHKKFPAFVKVVTKQTKTAWGGQERTDVIISWKKARASFNAIKC